MKFTLSIQLGNDAMQTGEDIAKALLDVATRLREDYGSDVPVPPERGRLRDANGNTVGTWLIA